MAGATWIPMARYFQQITSIEPYSIEQTRKLDVRLSMASVYKARNGNRWLDPGFSGSMICRCFILLKTILRKDRHGLSSMGGGPYGKLMPPYAKEVFPAWYKRS